MELKQEVYELVSNFDLNYSGLEPLRTIRVVQLLGDALAKQGISEAVFYDALRDAFFVGKDVTPVQSVDVCDSPARTMLDHNPKPGNQLTY